MADEKKKATKPSADGPSEADLGLDKGYLGTKVDPRPNEEYSLESGPDSPSAADVARDVEAARADSLEASQA